MKKSKYNVAIAGATGVVGKEMIRILEERKFPVDKIKLLASERRRSISFQRRPLKGLI